ncbi:MAG: hypothetical protein AAB347_10155 [Bacteroidota bacterium]
MPDVAQAFRFDGRCAWHRRRRYVCGFQRGVYSVPASIRAEALSYSGRAYLGDCSLRKQYW